MGTKLDISRGIVPLSDFRQSSKEYLKELLKTHEPIVITQNGHSAAVVMAPQDFQKLEYERNLFKAIAEGEKDFTDGNTISHDKLFAELLK